MHKYTALQTTAKIGDITLGGQPGQYPTVMIGSLFYRGHKIVTDHEKGIFDEAEAVKLIEQDKQLSRTWGLPRIIDVIGETADALERYVHFVAAHTDDPIMVDSPVEKVRLEAMKRLSKENFTNPLIYNSLDINASRQEIEALGELGVKHCVLMAFTSKSIRPFDRVRLLEGENSIIDQLRAIGVENILIDTGALDLPSIGWSALAIHNVKDKLGLPAGCAPSNSLYMWKRSKPMEKEAFQTAGAVAMSLPVAFGADFIFYGAMANAPWLYPAVAMMDAVSTFTVKEYGVRPLTSPNILNFVFS